MSAQSTKFLRAVDLKTHPDVMAREVIQNGIDAEHNWLLYFFRAFLAEMGDLERTQGGYRGEMQMQLSAYSRLAYGALLDAEAHTREYESKHANN